MKVKFPQAVITNIRALPPAFSKTFWTAVWRKTRDGCFWHNVCNNDNICVVGHLLKCALHLSSWRLKYYCIQTNSVGTNRGNIVPGNLCIIWKLSETWPLKKDLVTFLRLLKLLKLKKDSILGLIDTIY